ncbi:MAG TPA: hypothetical protein VN108_11280 [Marmoricola sp.]|nr:hypothetical protein [Marmoricola sp.]
MIVLILIVAAAALLGVGIGVDSTVLDAVALGLAALGVVIVLVTWLLPLLSKPSKEAEVKSTAGVEEPTPSEVADPKHGASGDSDLAVVFVAGRTTFHLGGCSLVAGKPTSRAQRGDLESGGMAACKRCIKT